MQHHAIVSPSALLTALGKAPNLDLVHTSGPLNLYMLTGAGIPSFDSAPYYATINTPSPDLRVLAKLPQGAALVFQEPTQGVPSIEEVPPVTDWDIRGNELTWAFVAQPPWTYEVVRLDSSALPGSKGGPPGLSVNRVQGERGSNGIELTIPAKDDLTNGSFLGGPWGPVGDCAYASGSDAQRFLSATVIAQGGPTSGPFLRLSARRDSACQSQRLTWHGGPVLLQIQLRHVAGVSPRLCLWETGPQHCAVIPPPTITGNDWTTYKWSGTPDFGTRALDLFLYADTEGDAVTTNDYANARVIELPSLPSLVLLGTPVTTSNAFALIIHHSSYSSSWYLSPSTEHVLVDGLLNGWLVPRGQAFKVAYSGDELFGISFVVSVLGVLVVLGLALSLVLWRDPRFGRRPLDRR